ncbi:MAG: ORF6N domain-containing protein, partial [Muribaculaceae bacterium]|nr:ORF6N domain-containing protein [Muribaculaceae bacterium]
LELIRSRIHEIRGQRVMLDFELAELYQVETRILNQAVKRNPARFPTDFMFQLTQDEWDAMSSQFVMTSVMKRPKRAIPYAFTEHGVIMLSSVLKSDVAIQVSILVARAFVAMRQFMALPKTDKLSILEQRIERLENYIEEVMADMNDVNEDTRMQIELISESLAELQAADRPGKADRPRIGFRP